MRVPELAAAFNTRYATDKTPAQIKAVLSNNKFTCRRKGGHPVGTSFIFSPEQVAWLKDNIAGKSHAAITAELNELFSDTKTVLQIKSYIKNHKLSTGLTGRFEQGHASWNSGTKGLVKPNSGNFKTGHAPANRKPLYSERICSKDGFILIKVPEVDPYTGSLTRYKHKHVWVWEQANGPVPEGMAVAFFDSNKLNCSIENLMLVTRAELLQLNQHGYKNMSEELRPSVLALAKLEVKAGFRTTPRFGGRKKKTHAEAS